MYDGRRVEGRGDTVKVKYPSGAHVVVVSDMYSNFAISLLRVCPGSEIAILLGSCNGRFRQYGSVT